MAEVVVIALTPVDTPEGTITDEQMDDLVGQELPVNVEGGVGLEEMRAVIVAARIEDGWVTVDVEYRLP